MAELSIVDGVFNLKVTQGTTSRFANGVDEESVEAAILVETNARIAADVYARSYPPTAPVEGKLWLRTVDDVRAVVDFRAYADGEPSLGDPDSTDWADIDRIVADPTYIGSNVNAKLIDFSGEFSGMYTANVPSITSGVMLSPTVAQSTIHTVAGIALTELRADDGPLTATVHRFTIGVDDLRVPSTDDTDDITRAIHRVGVFGYGGGGATSNGPCVEVRVDWVGADPVCRINAAWATPTEIDPSGSTQTSIGRLLERGDRVTCAVDFVNNQWWAELNGEEVADTRMGANTDFDTMDDLDDGVDTFIEQYKMMLFSAGSGADNWESGVIWAAYTLDDYAPNLVTIFKYDGEVWVPEITPAIATVGSGGGSGSPDSASTFTIPLIGQWNDPLITGAGIPTPVLSLVCSMDDVTPAFTPDIHIVADVCVVGGSPIADPDLDDLPAEGDWVNAQDVPEANVYGVFYVPIGVAPEEVLNEPIWFRFTSTDDEGFVTRCYAYIPNGVPDVHDEVDLFIFDGTDRYSMTIPDTAGDALEGDPATQSITITATAPVTPSAMSYVESRFDTIGGGAPSGTAGGALSGTYPNPSIASGAVTNSMLAGSIAQSKITDLATDLAAKYASTTALNAITAPAADLSLNSHKITNLTPGTASTDAVTFGQLAYPKRQALACSESPPNSYATWTPTQSAVTYNGYAAGATSVGAETWTYEFILMAGTWSVRWVYRKSSIGGVFQGVLAGVTLTTVDTYNAGNAEANSTETGITVATSGHHSMVITNPSKNGSSGGYGFVIHGFELIRTGP